MIQTGIVSKVKIQDILSNQLPEFIRDESPLTVDFLKQYYASQEYQGGSADISDNLEKYLNVDNLTPEVIVDSATTSGITTVGDEIVTVTSTKGFPNQYGLLKIDDEIITYTGVTTNTFTGCVRGFSGITSYHSDLDEEQLVFSTSDAAQHEDSSTVQNLSSLFLKEFYKKFKKTFLPGLEGTDFQSNLDVGTFIREARSLYQTKGTNESFRILFNVLYGLSPNILNLEERLIKPSTANYVRRQVCVAEVLSGDPSKLRGQNLLKGLTGQTLFRSDIDENINASISEIEPFERVDSGLTGISTYYKIGLFVGYDETSDVQGDFIIIPNSKSLEKVEPNSSVLTVDSTVGFTTAGTIISGSNTITYTDKTVNQFLNCTGIAVTINPIQNVRSDITYFGYEDGDLDKKVVLRLTGVLSRFEQEGNIDVTEGEVISVKNIGDKVENNNESYKQIFCNSWIYNTSSSYFITDKQGTVFTLGSPIDRSSIKKGDKVEIVGIASNTSIVSENTIIVESVDPVKNTVTLSDGVIPNFVTEEDKTKFKLRKKLNKPNSSGTPIEYGNDVLVSDVQNVYTENENAYVASNSLPSYSIDANNNPFQYFNKITASRKLVSLNLANPAEGELKGASNDQQDFTVIGFGTVTPFRTGDKIFYRPIDGDPLVGLETGSYFVDVLPNKKDVKLFGSPSGIDDGKNLTFSQSTNDGTHEFVLFSQRSSEIGAQKLVKQFPLEQNIKNGNNDLTPVGQTGMLINGVEITNYKSNDKIYFGPLSSVDVLNGGEDFDVINLPNIVITTGIGTTALVQPVITGKVEEIFVDPQSFDVDRVVSIGITGGNGSGCVLEPVIGTRFRKEFFNTLPTTSGGGINTTTETITFLDEHNFIDGEQIIYDSSTTDTIRIVGTGTDRLINGAIYYPKKTNNNTIELYETFDDYLASSNKINFNSSFGLGNHSFKVGLRNTLLEVKVIDSGDGYTNRQLFVKPTGISTGNDTVNFVNHGFSDGDLIEYNGNISGLSTNTRYYVLKNSDDSFSLSNAGVGGSITSNFNRRKVTNLESTGTGLQTFKYPDIKVFVEFDAVGVGTTATAEIKITPKVRGSIQQLYLYENGTGYGSTIINNHRKPIIRLQNGKNASLKPIINNGQIDKINIGFGGNEYFSVPDLQIIDPSGKGIGAKLRPVLKDQKIDDVIIINSGIGYSTNSSINVVSAGRNSFFNSNVRALTLNTHNTDDNQHLEESNNKLKYTFTGYSTSPFNDGGDTVSGIIGWAYDGNPIYGPFGYADPSNPPSNDIGRRRLVSGYQESSNNVIDRPTGFDPGFFIEDYVFNDSGDLDEHNGRFEKTLEFPNGVYAYHAIVDVNDVPQFPYFIGNSYRSAKIPFNVTGDSQTSFDFNKDNLLRNTFPYKVADDFANNDFLVETNEIQDQKIELNSVSSGSVTGFNIVFGGSGYKIDEVLEFDNTNTNGEGLVALISEIGGKDITNVDTSFETFENSVFRWSENIISVFTPNNHTLEPGDFVNISGLSTDISSLNGSFQVGVTTFVTTTISTISAAPTAGFTTEIYVANVPSSVSIGSSVGIGTETLKILNIYRDLNVLTIERTSGSAFATSHPKGTQVKFISNSFTIDKSINKFESTNNRKIFFNAKQSVGLGTIDGTETNVSFSFGGNDKSRNLSTRKIHLENHRLKTNQKIKFSKPVGSNIAVSTDTNPATTFNLPETLYAVNKNINTIGIKTGIGELFNEVYFISLTNADSDLFSFETDFEQVTGNIEKVKTTVSISTSHELESNDKIDLSLKPNLNVGIGTSSAVRVSRDSLTGNILINPVGFTSLGIDTTSNSINIVDHGFETGEKIKYTSDTLPEGLENKNYFVYKVDNNNIKLCDTFIDVTKEVPNVIGIGSTGGLTQSISLINPEIFSVKNNNLTFDLSDSSLNGYNFKLFYDSEYKNEFVSDSKTSNFNVVKVGSGLTIGYGNSIPEVLYYNLENSGNISTTDTEVKNSSKISFTNSQYEDSYRIAKIDDTSFNIFLKNKPERLSYSSLECDTLNYTTSSKTAKGSINKINIVSGGSNYKKVPEFIGIAGSSTGIDALIVPTSTSIGNVESVRIINEGFEYSSDKTLEPESLIASTVETTNSSILGIVSVTNGGSDYISAPNIIVVNSLTGEKIESGFLEPVMLENSIISVNVNEVPIGLPQDTVTLRTINNTNGITILEVKSNNTGTAFTCKLTTPTPQFPEDPFAINDRVFIEGIEKVTGIGSGFNSEDYGYKLLKVSGFNANVNGFAEVTIDVSEFTNTGTGVAKTEVATFATAIKKSDYPEFFVTQNQSVFEQNEKLIIDGKLTNLEVIGLKTGKLKIFGKTELKVGDIITGSNSGIQAEISKITKNKGRLKTDFSILKDLGWNDSIGKLNEDFQVIPDNDYYQNMSYSVQSPIEWRELRTTVNNILHTSGMKNFADTGITSTTNAGVGVSENVDIILDLFDERRVDEILIDTARDSGVANNVSRKIVFDNVRLSNYISCDTNDVLAIDNIDRQFSNLEGSPNTFLDLFEFNSNELFNNLLIRTNSTVASGTNELQLSEFLLLSNGTENLILEKSNLINSGAGFTGSEINNFVDFSLNTDPITSKTTFRFTPTKDPFTIDYDLKISSSKFTTSLSGVGTTSIGPINLTSGIKTCSAGITTDIISVPVNNFESLHVTVHVIDLATKEMNLVENLVSHTNTDTFLSQAYFNTDKNQLSTNQIGIITSGISGDNLVVYFENNGSNNIRLKSKVIGIGTTGVSDETYRFKSNDQLDGSERTTTYSGFSTVNVGVSTILDLNSQLFNSVKSTVEVSVGSSKAIHEVLAVHDGTDAYVQQSGSLSVTKDFVSEYDPSSGLGTFSASYSASKFKLLFHPDNSTGISTVVSLNQAFYTFVDTENIPNDLSYGDILEKNEVREYNAVGGNRVNRREFILKVNSVPIYGKTFNPTDTTKVNLSSGKFTINNHFFRENEQLVYTPQSTFVGVGSTPMQFKNGSIVDSLPTTVFAKTVTSNSFFISTTRAGTSVTFMGVGEGNAHEFSMAKSNEKSLIAIDDLTQYPLIETDLEHSLENNVGGQVGLTTNIINLSGISTISVNDILKIENEFVKITNVGFATTSGSLVGTAGTFNTIEVERASVGSIQTTHNDGVTVKRFKGNYNIVGSKIFFATAPLGNPSREKDESNLDIPTASFNGRVYLRNDYSTNQIFDDISDQFTGITTTFTLKVGGANTVGLGTSGGSGILFVNGIFQSPSTDNNPDKNFKILESGSGATGVTSVFFTGITSTDGSSFLSNTNINTNELPRGGIPISFGSTITGLGYAPLVGAKVKATKDATTGSITGIVGVAYTGSALGIVTATYNNVTGVITFQTVNEHRFTNSNEVAILDSLQFNPSITLSGNQFPVVSIASTNVFGLNIGKRNTSHVYVGSGNVSPYFSNLTFGSGYNGRVGIAVTVMDLGYEHRFVDADVNAIDRNVGSDITPTNATYDPVTGILVLTVNNHGMSTNDLVGIKTGSIRFTCERDNFKTVHPYPRSTDPVAGINTAITKLDDNLFSVFVGKNVGTGAQVTATAGVGGTAIFTVGAAGTDYKDPRVFVSEPSYANLPVTGISRLSIGATTETGSNLTVTAVVSASATTGIGSTLFEVSRYETVNSGYGFKKGDVIEAVGLVTAKGMGAFSPKSTLEVGEIYNDSFAMWQFGEFDYIDSIKSLQDGNTTRFPLKLNNALISVEASENLLSSVKLENIFLVTVNGIIQDPSKAYNLVGGTSINFSEAPVPEDDISILFYRGTGGSDSLVVEGQDVSIETGDEVRLESAIPTVGGFEVPAQNNRTVTGITTSTTLDTNIYQEQGISETISRPLKLIKQKSDKTINKVIVSKKRSKLEPRIIPIAKIISDINTSNTDFFVDNADLFNYEDEATVLINASITNLNKTNFVNASATATVSSGTVSGITITNVGSGYASIPTVSISAPPSIGVGVGTTATATATISNGQISSINVTNIGLGYTIAPQVLIESPIESSTIENLTTSGLTIQENTGLITGIGTTVFSSKLGIKFTIKRDGSTFTPLGIGTPFYVYDTRVGSGLTSLSVAGVDAHTVGIGTTFVDNVYTIASFQNMGSGVGIITCLIKSDSLTTGISSIGSGDRPVGKYSIARVRNFTRSSSPISIGVTGLTVDAGLTTFPTLKRTGGSDTFAKTGGLTTPT